MCEVNHKDEDRDKDYNADNSLDFVPWSVTTGIIHYFNQQWDSQYKYTSIKGFL